MSHFWNNNPELYDEITIAELPEPYKTWCENGEKPYHWLGIAYRWPVYKVARVLERLFPRLRSRFIVIKNKNPDKCDINRYLPGIAQAWYPYGKEFSLGDVPWDLVYPAAVKGEENYWAGRVDEAYGRYKEEQMMAADEGPEALQAHEERWGQA